MVCLYIAKDTLDTRSPYPLAGMDNVFAEFNKNIP